MLSTTIRSSFANQGQICLCGSRIFVERPIYEKFKTVFVEKVSRMKNLAPSSKSKQGAVVSKGHMEKVLSYIELAKEEGQILCGGKGGVTTPHNEGYFIHLRNEGLKYDCRQIRKKYLDQW